MMPSSHQSRLPDEYQEVEWLRGTGTQYCTTDYPIVYNSANKTVIKGDITVLSLSSKAAIGNRWSENGSAKRYAISYGETGSQGYAFIHYGSNTVNVNTPLGSNFPIDIHYEIGVDSLVINDQIFTRQSIADFDSGTEHINIGYIPVLGHYATNAEFKAFSIYDNNTLLTEVIPCYRKSDSKPGFYQTNVPEGGTNFITNLGTSTDWLIGPNVL